MPTLERIWELQESYNARVRQRESPDNYEYWMKQYLLGAVSEVDEILREINWKIHRRGHPMDRTNLARELADLTKYTLSLWQWSGFTMEEFLQYTHDKSLELEDQWQQDFLNEPDPGQPVILFDLDGTVGDYRTAFYKWLQVNHRKALPPDMGEHMAMEIDLGLPYAQYAEYKEEFEANGGYGLLDVYPDAWEALVALCAAGVYLAAYTARPAQRYSRIWSDSWRWLESRGLAAFVKELRIGQEARVARACELKAAGHMVLLLDDDPSTAIRAAAAGIEVVMRDQPYNIGVEHPNITRVTKFSARQLKHWMGVDR